MRVETAHSVGMCFLSLAVVGLSISSLSQLSRLTAMQEKVQHLEELEAKHIELTSDIAIGFAKTRR